MASSRLLSLALPLVPTHGFTRDALSRAALALPERPHHKPFSDSAVSALFGDGDDARKTLINAWLDQGLAQMSTPRPVASLREVLQKRLEYNEPVLQHLPEAFALLASPKNGLPPLDPTPALKHAARIANEACYAIEDQSLQLAWYRRRASIAAVYAAAELHQLGSPATAGAFLDSLLETSATVDSSIDNVGQFSNYVLKSWKGIIKSSGILL